MWKQLEPVVFPKGDPILVVLENKDIALAYAFTMQQRETLLHERARYALTSAAYVYGQMVKVSPSTIVTA
jgi:hypothetical protein